MERFEVDTEQRLSVIDITDRVAERIPPDATGTATVFVEHTTAGVTVNEAESRLLEDFEAALSELVGDSGWKHDQIDDNADSHVRSLLVGPDVTVPVVDGSLRLGRWQSVLFVECDGPRTRSVRVVA
ncbi:YjbQ family protein [Halovenus sp. WSH3]|uniref:YjbQ family protein n=1 Tax=Halovenus carboxidivorans TaxID=2692199 RepID=A0A6B0TC60_9EURY|nr:secondary thiamine-phosphate synthase enzyme YjbQ [Halovenus carboxidivorans]MXR50789.1 YjbQ family protein [Halovenus carboxidivorans]